MVRTILQASLLTQHTIFSTGIWQDKGCYANKADSLALPDPFETGVGNLQGNENIFLHCSKQAEYYGYTVFGVDDKNCWAGNDAENTYDDYGKSSKCTVGKTGYGSGKEINADMFVYRYHDDRGKLSIMWAKFNN